MQNKIILFTVMFFAFTIKVNAQGAFDEIAKSSDKTFSKAATNQHPTKGNKKGQSGPYWAAFNGQISKRIALVTFYVYDKPFSEVQKNTDVYYGFGPSGVGLYEKTSFTTYTKNITKDGASIIVSDFFCTMQRFISENI